jgi:hypothetical protein
MRSLAPPARYSADIDLVAVGSRPAEHIRRAIRRVLVDVLGMPYDHTVSDSSPYSHKSNVPLTSVVIMSKTRAVAPASNFRGNGAQAFRKAMP